MLRMQCLHVDLKSDVTLLTWCVQHQVAGLLRAMGGVLDERSVLEQMLHVAAEGYTRICFRVHPRAQLYIRVYLRV